MDTLLLDVVGWDLCLDAKGDIAVASLPYAAAQNAASAVKLFQGEYYYDTTKGVPYLQSILGRRPPLSLIRADYIAAARAVPDVVKAQCFFSSFKNNVLSGQVVVVDVNGQASVSSF